MRPTPTPPSPISTATAIWWPRSSAWSASASSATPTRAPRSWPKRPASPSSSPTSCATWPRMRAAIASICRSKISRPTMSRSILCCIAQPGAPPTANERALLAAIAQRARRLLSIRQELLPLIDRESRPALWVLVSIYHGLLKRIERRTTMSFPRRASVPMPQKLGILVVGLARMGWARLFA